MQVRTKLIWCAVWLLAGALVLASVDGTPDPPAVDPHSALLKVLSQRDCGDLFRDPSGCCDTRTKPAPVRLPQALLEQVEDCERPSDCVVRVGQASDPSPPAPAGLFQS